MGETRDIQPPLVVLFLPQEWQHYARRPHWRAVGRLVPLLAVEPPVGLLTFWRHPRRLMDWLRERGRVDWNPEGLHLMRPLSLATFGLAYRVPFLRVLDRLLIGRQVRRAIAKLGGLDLRVAAFIVKIPQSHLAGAVGADINCYEVTDEYRVTTYHERIDPRISFTARAIRRETPILRSADLVVVSSEALRDIRSRENSNTHYLPNCAEYEHFARAADEHTSIPEDLATLPSPRLGLIGNLTNLIDVELLLQLARTHTRCSLVFVGNEEGTAEMRRSEGYVRLKACANVHFLGYRNYDTLPGYVKGLDVCLLPYRLTAWMRASSPNKTYQYLAAGKPIVAIDFPEIRPVSEVVFVGRSREEFVQLINRALHSNSAEVVARRQSVARANDTAARARALVDLICSTLEKKDGERHTTSGSAK